MALKRAVEPELLDALPADDSRAIRSRRDLKRVNVIMLQQRIMLRLLREAAGGEPPRSILELGSGDGTFMLGLARKLAPQWRSVALTMVDLKDIVTPTTRQAIHALGWTVDVVRSDVFDFLEAPGAGADLIATNLFLHHFGDAALARMLSRVAAVGKAFAACEPRRAAMPLAASRMLWAVGCNGVSRHDAAASVRAGFLGEELSKLWPEGRGFEVREGEAGLFTHVFVARRNA